MKVIIPMAGLGDRFVRKGYTKPKPLIEADGKPIIDYILDMFDLSDEIVCICNKEHVEKYKIDEELYLKHPNMKVVVIDNHKKGPIYTVQQAYDYIKDDEEVIISYCDNPYIWDYEDFKNYVKVKKLDGCILSHIGNHPHALNSTKMAFMKVDKSEPDFLVTEIKEKESYTNDHLSEFASTGTYYFAKGSYVKKYFDEAVEKNIQYNGEFYVTLCYNLLIKDGLKVGQYCTQFVTVFGTPEELESFNAWSVILKSGQVKNVWDAVTCYNYWSRYHETKSNFS